MAFSGLLFVPTRSPRPSPPSSVSELNLGAANLILAATLDILLQGIGTYYFLNQTVCNIAPYVASFDVTYNNGYVSASQPRNIQPLQNNNSNVATFLSVVMYELALSSQTLYNNPLGEVLRVSGTSSLDGILVSNV